MKKIILLLVVAAGFTGCLKPSENVVTCSYNPCGQSAPPAEVEKVKEYLSVNNLSATQHCSGLFYIIDNPGTGVAPTVCNNVTVNYEGKLTNGIVFESPAEPVTFNLSGLIGGFKNGIPLIKTGGRIRLFIPPSLGYGNNPQGSSIPANSILIFDVRLLDVR